MIDPPQFKRQIESLQPNVITASHNKLFIRIILIIVSVILMLIFTLFLLNYLNIISLPDSQNKTVLKINDKSISNKDYQEVVSYLQFFLKNKDKSVAKAKEIFIVNEILKRELLKQEHINQEDFEQYLKETNQNITINNLGQQLELENAYLMKILTEESLSWYSGEYIFVRFDNPQLNINPEGQKRRAKRKIDEITTKWRAGTSFKDLMTEYNQDQELKTLNNNQSFANTFDKLLISAPTIKAPEILTVIPKLEAGQISEVITISDPLRLGEIKPVPFAYAVVKLTASHAGNVSSAEEFINQAKNGLKIEFFVK